MAATMERLAPSANGHGPKAEAKRETPSAGDLLRASAEMRGKFDEARYAIEQEMKAVRKARQDMEEQAVAFSQLMEEMKKDIVVALDGMAMDLAGCSLFCGDLLDVQGTPVPGGSPVRWEASGPRPEVVAAMAFPVEPARTPLDRERETGGWKPVEMREPVAEVEVDGERFTVEALPRTTWRRCDDCRGTGCDGCAGHGMVEDAPRQHVSPLAEEVLGEERFGIPEPKDGVRVAVDDAQDLDGQGDIRTGADYEPVRRPNEPEPGTMAAVKEAARHDDAMDRIEAVLAFAAASAANAIASKLGDPKAIGPKLRGRKKGGRK